MDPLATSLSFFSQNQKANNNKPTKKTKQTITTMISKTAISTFLAGAAVLCASSSSVEALRGAGNRPNRHLVGYGQSSSSSQPGCAEGQIHVLWTESAQQTLMGGSTEGMKLQISDPDDNVTPTYYDDWNVYQKVCVDAPILPGNNNEHNVVIVPEESNNLGAFESNTLPFSTDPETALTYALCISSSAVVEGGTTDNNPLFLYSIGPNEGCSDLEGRRKAVESSSEVETGPINKSGCSEGQIHLLWTEAAQQELVGGSTEGLKLAIFDPNAPTVNTFYDNWTATTKVCVDAPQTPGATMLSEFETMIVEASCDGTGLCHPESNHLPYSTDSETAETYALCISRTALGASHSVALSVLSPNEGCVDLE